MKDTNQLIEELAKNHIKVKRIFSPITYTFISVYTLLATIFLFLYVISPYQFKFHSSSHFLEIISLFLLIHSLTYLGFKSFIPGELKKRAILLAFFNLVLMLIVFMNRFTHPQIYGQMRSYCELESMGISLMTTVFGHVLISRNEFARSNYLSSMLIIALPITATFFMHGVCSINLMHVISCHLMAPLLFPIFYLCYLKKRMGQNAPTTSLFKNN